MGYCSTHKQKYREWVKKCPICVGERMAGSLKKNITTSDPQPKKQWKWEPLSDACFDCEWFGVEDAPLCEICKSLM